MDHKSNFSRDVQKWDVVWNLERALDADHNMLSNRVREYSREALTIERAMKLSNEGLHNGVKFTVRDRQRAVEVDSALDKKAENMSPIERKQADYSHFWKFYDRASWKTPKP